MDKTKKIIIGAVVGILIVGMILWAVFTFVSKNAKSDDLSNDAKSSNLPFFLEWFVDKSDSGALKKSDELTILLDKDLQNAYPETPTEVVKLYWRINKYMYNKDISDEDLEKLMKQLRMLYADEFLAGKNNSLETMLKNFKQDKKDHEGETIVSAVVEKYDSVKVNEKEDKTSYAEVIVARHTKKKGKTSTMFESFMCQKEEKGKWKILGWKTATQQEAIDAGVQ